MKVALLLGFRYGNSYEDSVDDKSRNHLPGIIIDLYQAYQQACIAEADKIIVLTDIEKDQKTQLLLNAMIGGIVDANILSFIQILKENSHYLKYVGREQLIEVTSNITQDASQVFIYYTGHGSLGNLLLPRLNLEVTFISDDINPVKDEAYISMIVFRNLILSSADNEAYIFIVMDCCNGTGLDLPFRLEGKVYRLAHTKATFFQQKIICISSAMSDQSSGTSRNGSLFSQAFFRQLRTPIHSMSSILATAEKECAEKYHQTAMIHSSYPDEDYIWIWLINSGKLNIKIDNINYIVEVVRPIVYVEESRGSSSGSSRSILKKKDKLLLKM